MRILILGARAPVALEMARCLEGAGHAVLAADSVSCHITGASRAVAATLPKLPPPRTQLPAYAAALCHHILGERIELVVPTCEEVFYLARIRPQLPAGCAVFTAPFELLRQLHSKVAVLKLASDAGIRVPHSTAIDSLEEARAWAGSSDVVLKPEYSRFGVHVRRYAGGIPPSAAPLPPLGRWVAQRRCTGVELCSYAIAWQGRLCANVTYLPAHRIAGSSSYYFEPRHVPAIDAAVAALVSRLGYHGQISFDWFVEAQGEPTLIECNPRAISGLHLLPHEVLGAALLEGRAAPFDPAALRPRMLGAVMLAAGLPRALLAGQPGQWWRDWRRAGDVLAGAGDSAPLLGALRDLASFTLAARRQRCSLREASTRDIEWDGQPLSA